MLSDKAEMHGLRAICCDVSCYGTRSIVTTAVFLRSCTGKRIDRRGNGHYFNSQSHTLRLHYFYVDIITCPCPKLSARSTNRCKMALAVTSSFHKIPWCLSLCKLFTLITGTRFTLYNQINSIFLHNWHHAPCIALHSSLLRGAREAIHHFTESCIFVSRHRQGLTTQIYM